MRKSYQNPKIVAATVTFLLAIAVIGLVASHQANENLLNDLTGEKIKSERLLSEKLLLDKEIAKLKQSFETMKGQNAELDKLLNSASTRLENTEKELSRTQKENATLKNYKKQVAEIQKIKTDLESQVASLTKSLASVNNENESLNRLVADLQLKNKNLTDEISNMQVASLDNMRVDAYKKNKQTVSARKTNKLEANFIVSANKSTDNLQFKIIDANGKALSATEGTIAFIETNATPVYTADNTNNTFLTHKQIKMEYTPKKKLKAGVYKIEIIMVRMNTSVVYR